MIDNIKMPPHSMEAEQAILGCIILDFKTMEIVFKRIKPNAFYKEQHRIMYESMIGIHARNKPIDLMILIDDLKTKGVLESVGGIEYITSLQTIVPTTSNIEHYINIINEKFILRSEIKDLTQILSMAYSNTTSLDVLNKMKDSINNIDVNTNIDFIEDITDIPDIDEDKEVRVSTGFYELDRLTRGGYKLGTLNILYGDEGAGKSTILNQMAIAEGIAQGYKVFLYSGELSSSLAKRWLSRTIANEEHLTIKKGQYGEFAKENEYCKNCISEWLDGKFFLHKKQASLGLDELISRMTYLNKKYGVEIFIIDNLMKFIASINTDNELMAQTEIINRLSDFAQDTGVLVHLVAHCRKRVDRKIPPVIEDISGSGNIKNLADYVTAIHRIPEDIKEEKGYSCGVYIQKNRHGKLSKGPLRLQFEEIRHRFYTSETELDRDFGYDENRKFVQVEADDIPF